VAILAHLFYTFKAVLSQRTTTVGSARLERKEQDPRVLERDAGEAAARGDYITAVRLLFRASLLRLEQQMNRKARPGLTNREWLRRYQHSTVHGALRLFVDTIDVKWYGGGSCSAADYEGCMQAHAVIRGMRLEGPHADRA